jgi:hypothetical protein
VAEAAAREGVSMSQWVSEVLARQVGVLNFSAGMPSSKVLSDLLEELRSSMRNLERPGGEESAVQETG